jgi:hypothetical protein
MRTRGAQHRLDPLRHRDVGAQADGHGVRSLLGDGIVIGQLEAGEHEQLVFAPGTGRLALDRGEVRLVVRGTDVAAVARGVICDREDVEAAPAVEIDHLFDPEGAVTPGRMGVELTKERHGASLHPTTFFWPPRRFACKLRWLSHYCNPWSTSLPPC